MSNPTTGEWMASTVEIMFMANPKNAHYAIADAHNAAIAAEREITFASQQAALKEGIRADELAKQLDAERENHQRAVNVALDLKIERDQLREQLAAERGAKNHMEACRALLNVPYDEVLYGAIEELQQQLAAARKLQQLTEDNQVRWMQNCEKLEQQLALSNVKP